MTVKPQFQILVMVGAMVFAAALSYVILHHNKPEEPPPPMESVPVSLAPLPEITFFDHNGQATALKDFKGQVLLVNLWATWCTPCVVELPALEKLQAKLKDKNFHVIALSVDRSSAKEIDAFLKQKGIEQLEFYWDRDRAVPGKWPYNGIPVSFLIDRDGNVVEKFEGPRNWEKKEFFTKIEELLK